jgi:hypothetical protein
MTRTGGCLCKAVRYECAGEAQFSLQCHCRDCQLQSGAPHIAAVRMPSAQPWDHMDPAVPTFETYPTGKSY